MPIFTVCHCSRLTATQATSLFCSEHSFFNNSSSQPTLSKMPLVTQLSQSSDDEQENILPPAALPHIQFPTSSGVAALPSSSPTRKPPMLQMPPRKPLVQSGLFRFKVVNCARSQMNKVSCCVEGHSNARPRLLRW